MKISKSKQELARIISESGGWRDGDAWASQDKGWCVYAYKAMPRIEKGWSNHESNGLFFILCKEETIKNWHQTILSRAEYLHLYPAPDADGWIEWKGGKCPVESGTLIDVKYRDDHLQLGCRALDRCDSELYATTHWGSSGGAADIIAYRLHKPEQQLGELCDKVTEENKHEHVGAKPTIEQLVDDYQQAVMLAEIKQHDADAAKADADSKLKALELAGETIGLLVSPITEKKEPGLIITDWRDLMAGDVIIIHCFGDVYSESKVIDVGDNKVRVKYHTGANRMVDLSEKRWEFIRRP